MSPTNVSRDPAYTPFATAVRRLRRRKAKPWPLPLTCTVGAARLRGLIEEDRVTPEPLAGFAEPRIALGYGRARLDPPRAPITPDQSRYCPAVLVFAPQMLAACGGVRLFPFSAAHYADDGPGAKGSDVPDRQGAADHRSIGRNGAGRTDAARARASVDDYEVPATLRCAAELVQVFHGTNEAYLNGNPEAVSLAAERRRSPAVDYYEWLQALDPVGRQSFATIEALVTSPIPLSTTLQAVVVPTLCLTDRIVTDFLLAYRIPVYAYTHLGARSGQPAAAVNRLLVEHAASSGPLS